MIRSALYVERLVGTHVPAWQCQGCYYIVVPMHYQDRHRGWSNGINTADFAVQGTVDRLLHSTAPPPSLSR
jgi:hypothetical protein